MTSVVGKHSDSSIAVSVMFQIPKSYRKPYETFVKNCFSFCLKMIRSLVMQS